MDAIGLLAGTGWASGLNVYAVALLLGLLGRTGLAEVPDVLGRTEVLAVVGAAFAVDFVVDKVPVLDSIWDAAHTVIRPLGAAVLGAILAGDLQSVSEVGAAIGTGALALGSHAVKASARAAINTSPEPFSNGIVSVAEDGLVAGVVLLAVTYPLVALGAVVFLSLAGAALLAVIATRLRRALRRRRDRRTRGT